MGFGLRLSGFSEFGFAELLVHLVVRLVKRFSVVLQATRIRRRAV